MDAVPAAEVERIAADEIHGSSWLAREAVTAVAEAAQRGEDPLALARELVRARPDVGAIRGALGRVLVAGRTTEQLVEEAEALIGSRERAAATIAVLLRPELEERIVMTHSASATAREALVHASPGRVVCTVSSPPARAARSPRSWPRPGSSPRSWPTRTPSTPSAPCRSCSSAPTPSSGTGSLLNKAGTSSLAKAARKAKVPVVVASEVLKIAPADPRRPSEERVDLTPADRITQIVTEEGAFAPDQIAALVDRTPFLAEGYALLSE